MSLAVSQECLEFFTKALSRLSEGPKRYRAPDSVVQAFDAALEVVLSTPVSRHIARRSLAVIDDSGLLYPSELSQAKDLVAGNTVVLHELERTSLFFANLIDSLPPGKYSRISFSAYISSPRANKLHLHDDLWDNVVIQLRGRKQFRFTHYETEELAPGDVLVIPQEVTHDVETVQDSLHLSTVLLPLARQAPL